MYIKFNSNIPGANELSLCISFEDGAPVDFVYTIAVTCISYWDTAAVDAAQPSK